MKRISTLLTLVGALGAAGHARASEANVFDCVGQNAKGEAIQLKYTSSSFTGQPTFSLKVGEESLVPVDEARAKLTLSSDETAVGNLVAAVIQRKDLADAPDTTYAVLVPNVLLNRMGEVVEFRTVLLSGFKGGFRKLPLVTEVLNQTDALTCQAREVNF
ncbi:MAG TPA: hypothetical protein VM901_08175 [Bdellovibrionota bacterium]|nr:hypothetical protein [Bdellovibrionota bacterium]